MLKNYFKIAFRHLLRTKTISSINIIGLSSGFAVVILISLWIYDELSYDTYHDHYGSIAKVRMNLVVNDEVQTTKTVPLPLAAELSSNYNHLFEHVVLSSHRLDHTLATEEKAIVSRGVFMGIGASSMLSLRLIAGTHLPSAQPNSILLSASAAKALFNDDNVVGRTVYLDREHPVQVYGVFTDLPDNTTLSSIKFISPFALYINNSNWIRSMSDVWSEHPVQLYVQLKKNVNIDDAAMSIKNIVAEKLATKSEGFTVMLEPMADWRLFTYKDGKRVPGALTNVQTFAVIAVIILLLACFNFINLSTAQSERRAKEVGIRKTMGSGKFQLLKQFLSESVLLCFFSFIVALLVVWMVMPYFNLISEKNIAVDWSNIYLWIAGIFFCIITGLLAGAYPAFFLSSFKPVAVFKGASTGKKSNFARRALVIFQFSMSVMLTICTVIVFLQLKHGKTRDAGYDPQHLVLVPLLSTEAVDHFDALREELIKTGLITDMARSESTTTDIWGTEKDLKWKGKDPDFRIDFPNTGVSANYGSSVGWKFLAGRDFRPGSKMDSTSFILNEAAVKFMGLRNPVGEKIYVDDHPFTVIGVIKDMVVESPYEPVRPSMYTLARNQNNFAILKLKLSGNTKTALKSIETIFRSFSPSMPFQYSMIDEQYEQKFRLEQQVLKLGGFFTALAIVISSLGIFAMASFTIERRSREISIRKVFGASAYAVWYLITKQLTGLVLLSIFIAVPIAHYAMYNWLQHYHYRISISWWIFCLAALLIILITLATVSFQSIKAAISSPLKSLRNE